MTKLDVLKDVCKLKRLEYLPFHPNANDCHSYGYVKGYDGFFGPPVYGERTFYNHVFTWTTGDNKSFMVVIKPVLLDRNSDYPKEDKNAVLIDLQKYIEQTL